MSAIYDQSAHEALTETEWNVDTVEQQIAAIVADAESALDRDDFWPVHPLDDGDDLTGAQTAIYLGAAGVILALHRLGSSLDLPDLALAALDRYLREPDFGERVPSLWMGESGLVLVASIVGADIDVARLAQLAHENEQHPSNELMWGSPGTAIAARVAGFEDAWRRSAEILVDRLDHSVDGLWLNDLYGRQTHYIGPAHGFVGAIEALRGHFSDSELRARIEPVLRANASTEGALVNWRPVVETENLNRTQWCHGAPGIVATVGDLLPDDLLTGGSELTWHSGPLAKGPGLCHGTAGNGYAFLRMHAITGDESWLDRARRFAMHALEQVDHARATHGRGRYTLFTGDVGAALYARACMTGDRRFPAVGAW